MELEVHEPSSGLSPRTAFGFLLRVANIADVAVFAHSISLGALEKETGMNSGGIVRQCLRLGAFVLSFPLHFTLVITFTLSLK